MISANPLLGQPAFLSGRQLYLRALCPADADGAYPTWFNHAETCAGNSHHVFPYTRQDALDYIEYARKTRDSLILAIVLKDRERHIGNIALQGIHSLNRSAEFSILIGEPTARGKGVGREAGRLLCDHGFAALNLHRIACGTFAGNTAMRSLATALGMQEEGVRRQAAFKDGAYIDVVEFGVLREEYLEYWRTHPADKPRT